jgi:zinc transport system permease protein
MGDFLRALAHPDLPFLRYALAAGLLASVAFGAVGSYVVVRRITYVADAVAHCVLGGIAAALYLRYVCGCDWCHPMLGAAAAALAAAWGIGLVTLFAKEREDTVISIVWVCGVAIGLLLLHQVDKVARADPWSYLFGDILLISRDDLWLVAGLDAVVLLLAALFRNKLAAVCFDEEFSQLRGVPARLYYLFLLSLAALTIVLLVRIVGALLVVALLTLPAAAAGRLVRRLGPMMAVATVLCMACIAGGMAVAYRYNLAPGPVIVLGAAAVYLLSAGAGRLVRRA